MNPNEFVINVIKTVFQLDNLPEILPRKVDNLILTETPFLKVTPTEEESLLAVLYADKRFVILPRIENENGVMTISSPAVVDLSSNENLSNEYNFMATIRYLKKEDNFVYVLIDYCDCVLFRTGEE